MDTAKAITHVSLCAGYGGIDLGLKRAISNLRTVAFSEIEAFACANLVAKMEAGQLDPAPVWTDLKTFPWSGFRDRVDILSGGYPCQPFSAAGKRRGKDDPRHLWPWIADGIRIMRPRVCFFENVEGHISLGLREVVEELASIGYETTWGIFSAAEVGAPHQRKRVFILAHDSSAGLQELRTDAARDSGKIEAWPSRPRQPQHGWEPPRVVGDGERFLKALGWELGDTGGQESRRISGGTGREEMAEAGQSGDSMADRDELGLQHATDEQRDIGPEDRTFIGARASESCGWQAQPALGRNAHGPAGRLGYAELSVSCDNRTDELRLLGNGVVPATAERAFRTLMNQLETP
jgi:DNA (cytosine-5)-methyltransferase 1